MSSFIRPLLRSTRSTLLKFNYIKSNTMATAATPVASAPGEMQFTFSSPAEILYREAKNVKQIDVPSLSGNFGILANHVPLLAVLKPGVVTVHEEDGKSKKFFVSSGSVSINPDSTVQILAEEAFSLEDFDAKAAQEQLVLAQQALGQAKNELEKAEAQIQVECAEAIVRAVQTGA
jgi:F-type H+-transporting ATPase subunit delta